MRPSQESCYSCESANPYILGLDGNDYCLDCIKLGIDKNNEIKRLNELVKARQMAINEAIETRKQNAALRSQVEELKGKLANVEKVRDRVIIEFGEEMDCHTCKTQLLKDIICKQSGKECQKALTLYFSDDSQFGDDGSLK